MGNTGNYLFRWQVYIIINLLFFIFLSNVSYAQGNESKQHIIQFVGIVIASDSISPISHVHVFVPRTGRGTTTNLNGFFSMPVLEGDSIVFSSVGLKRAYFQIPKRYEHATLKKIIILDEDVTFLREVEIRPYPTEAMFKAALINMDLPEEKEYANIYQWLHNRDMQLAYQALRASPNENFRNYMNVQHQSLTNSMSPSQLQLLNPFAWKEFIKAFKKK